MTDIEIQITVDFLAATLRERGLDADQIEGFLTSEAQRAAQEIRDEIETNS